MIHIIQNPNIHVALNPPVSEPAAPLDRVSQPKREFHISEEDEMINLSSSLGTLMISNETDLTHLQVKKSVKKEGTIWK